MKPSIAIRRVALVCIGLILLPGCGVAGGSATAQVQGATSATAKPGAGLAVQALGTTAFASGASARVNLSFLHALPGTTLTVAYRTEPGVVLESAAQATLPVDARGMATDAPLLRGTADGRHYLNVFVTQDGAPRQPQRAVSIPVTFGEASAQKKTTSSPGSAAVVTPAGESLVILPASPRRD